MYASMSHAILCIVNMVLNGHMETTRIIRDGEGGYGDWGRGRLYTCRCTVTTTMIPALRWAAMRPTSMFQ